MLETYQKKRDFTKTPEPRGKEQARRKGPQIKDGFFVIQKHDASRLHYDLRLACEGVLKSWAVPKGPSLNPADKRLAVETEDHPLAYGDFEGTIPPGEYGGGTVMLWDRGTFDSADDPCRALKKGKLKFHLHGEKLQGGFELVRMRRDSNNKPQWLLIKLKDDFAENHQGPVLTQNHSVSTGRSMEDIAGETTASASRDTFRQWFEGRPGVKHSKAPPVTKPQLATLVDRVPEGDRWLHEIKWDGYRLLAEKHEDRIRLWTRQRKDWTQKFVPIAQALEALPAESFLLDGELVVLDANGRSHFQNLQQFVKEGKRAALTFYAFDLLFAEGFDLRALPLEERKEALRLLLHPILSRNSNGAIRYSDHIEGEGGAFFRHACRIDLEGIIAKRRTAPYAPTRTRDWLKVKCTRRQEFVVCGYTPPSGSRRFFGSLALAVHEKDRWRYAGQVGTGFNQSSLKAIHAILEPLTRKSAPLSAGDRRDVPSDIIWTTPRLVVEVAYTEVTQSGRLRHPSFQGIREDKKAEDVTWERLVALPSAPRKATSTASPPAAELTVPKDARIAGIRISNPEREIFPEAGVTKAEVAVYYERVAPHLLAFLARRPLSVLRCPRGLQQKCFFQKHFRESVPASVQLIQIDEKRGQEPYSYVTNAAGIVSLVQYGVLEFHPWGSRIDKLERPDNLIFDLDPDEGVSWQAVLEATFALRDFLEDLGLKSFLKVSGGKGLHVCVPIERRTDWPQAKDFCHSVALRMAEQDPRRWIAQASKAKRKGKVFLDYLRNGRGATAVAPYSVRARAGAPVALPIAWEEADKTLRPNGWNVKTALARLENQPDPWATFWSTRQSITKAMLTAVGAGQNAT